MAVVNSSCVLPAITPHTKGLYVIYGIGSTSGQRDYMIGCNIIGTSAFSTPAIVSSQKRNPFVGREVFRQSFLSGTVFLRGGSRLAFRTDSTIRINVTPNKVNTARAANLLNTKVANKNIMVLRAHFHYCTLSCSYLRTS